MSRNVIETIREDIFKAEIMYDEDPPSPKDWDQAGQLVTWHRNYCWDVDGQKTFGDPQEFLRQAKAGRWVILPVGMYDHSGVSLYEGTGPGVGDTAGWDSGQVGFMYTTRARFLEMCDNRVSGWRKRALECLRAELETWDVYVHGQVYGYAITLSHEDEPDSDDVLDSCWGIYGLDYARQEAVSALKYAAKVEQDARAMVERSFAL